MNKGYKGHMKAQKCKKRCSNFKKKKRASDYSRIALYLSSTLAQTDNVNLWQDVKKVLYEMQIDRFQNANR